MQQRKSLGKLRKAKKTKERSPDMTGHITLYDGVVAAIKTHMRDNGLDDAVCNLAAWVNRDANGQYLTVQLSPPYVQHNQQPQRESGLDFVFGDEGDA
jgi:hypothetical protein